MLGITESSASALFTFNTAEVESWKITEDEDEPATYQAALKSPQAEKWKQAMRQEWQVLIENRTFDIVEENQINHPFHCDRHTESKALSMQNRVCRNGLMQEPISCKWIYRRKINPDGTT